MVLAGRGGVLELLLIIIWLLIVLALLLGRHCIVLAKGVMAEVV